MSSLPKGISSTLNFHENIDTDGTRTYNLANIGRSSKLIIIINFTTTKVIFLSAAATSITGFDCEKLPDLDYADDTALFEESDADMVETTEAILDVTGKLGLKMSYKRPKLYLWDEQCLQSGHLPW